MASKRCSSCKARNKVIAKKCTKCGESFEKLASGFVQGTAWSAADQYEASEALKDETEKFWRVLMILGIIFTATFFLIGFGLPFLAVGIYGSKKGISESSSLVKFGILAGSIILGILAYQYIMLPLFF